MAIELINLRLTGTRPLLMHNGRLANPLDEYTRALKKLTSKRQKTEDDILEIKRVEWLGSLYTDPEGRIALTEDMILACFLGGSKKDKNGKQAAVAIQGESLYYSVKYDGPKNIDKLYEDGGFCDYRAVRVGQAKVMRSRPIFRSWSVDVALDVDTSILGMDEVIQAAEKGGSLVGLGDFRPRYGRFTVEQIAASAAA